MARSFAGGTDVVDFGDVTFMDGATQISGHAWVYLDNLNSDSGIIGKGAAAGGIWSWMDISGAGETDTWTVSVWDADPDQTFVVGNTNEATTGAWYSVGWTFESASATGMKSYVNGTESVNSPGDATAVGAFPNVGGNLEIGAVDGGRNMEGDIAEVAIWVGVILTGANFTSLAAGVPAHAIQPANLQLYSPFGKASPEPNYGLAGGTGTVTGTTVSASPYIIRPDDTKHTTRGVGRGITRGVA